MNNNTNAVQMVAARSNLGLAFSLTNYNSYGIARLMRNYRYIITCHVNKIEEFDYKGNGQFFCRCKSNSVFKKTTRSDIAFYNYVVTFYVPVDKCVSL